MASNYPGSLDSFDTIASDKKTSDAVGGRTHRQMHNDLGDAIEAVQTELGANPSGSDATVAARLTAIEAGTNLGTNSVGTTQIAANAVGASELADNAVDTAAIQDSAVTSAKIADGTIVSGDVAAGTFAAFGTVGNLLTANQAGCVSGFTSDGSISYGNPAAGSFTVANPWTYLIGTNVAVTPGDTYTCQATLTVTGGSNAYVVLHWRTSGGADISSNIGTAIAAGTTGVSSVTAVAPPTAAYAVFVAYDAGNTTIVVTEPGLWVGAAGQWQLPGAPIPGQSRIAVNNAVDLSGTGSPEWVVTAAPGSTWLQTDATTDVKGWIRWDKATGTGNTGWQAGAEADTGRRDVSSLMSANATDTVDYVRLRRVGATVRLSMQMANSVTATAHELFAAGAIPTGFRPTSPVVPGVGTRDGMSSATLAGLSVAAGGSAHYSVPDGSYYYFEASWVTTDTWPSSLPGSAA